MKGCAIASGYGKVKVNRAEGKDYMLKRPFLDKSEPEVWKAAGGFSVSVKAAAEARGLSAADIEYINVRVSQMNGCAYCLNLHAEKARDAGVTQQKLDMLPAWRESNLFDDREKSLLGIAEAATTLPLSEDAIADLYGAKEFLGDEVFAAAEWVATAINAFNRVSILSNHPVMPRK